MSGAVLGVLGDGLMVVGGMFMLLGAVGLVRMPDVFNRIQAATKAVTLGTLALLAGVLAHHPDWWAKIVVIVVFVAITSPVGSSTIARAALAAGARPWQQPGQQPGDGDTAARARVDQP